MSNRFDLQEDVKIPEGPELRRSADDLTKLIVGKRLRSVEILGGRYSKKEPGGLSDILPVLKQAVVRVARVDVKGKFMWWKLIPSDGTLPWYVWCTYGMSGQWINNAAPYMSKVDKHVGIRAWFNEPLFALDFRDPRHFGTIKFVNNEKQHQRKLNSLGPDMLSSPPDFEGFLLRIQKHRDKTIAEALMNQSCISGVGNYVKTEALYLAKISPHRIIDTLYMSEIKELRTQIINVMRTSYSNGGATISTYQNVDGTKGKAQMRFVVYSNKVDPLGNQVVKEETADGRTTWWVPSIQK